MVRPQSGLGARDERQKKVFSSFFLLRILRVLLLSGFWVVGYFGRTFFLSSRRFSQGFSMFFEGFSRVALGIYLTGLP